MFDIAGFNCISFNLAYFFNFANNLLLLSVCETALLIHRARKFENSTSGCSPWVPIMHNIGIASQLLLREAQNPVSADDD